MIPFASDAVPRYAIYRSLSEASGMDGRLVERKLREVGEDVSESVAQSGNSMKALSALNELFSVASEGNWDGESGIAVTPQVFANARRFLEQVPTRWETPEVSADPDGEISFEWSSDVRRRFSVSIGSDERISSAWLVGSERGHSVNIFLSEVPRQLLDHVDQVLAG